MAQSQLRGNLGDGTTDDHATPVNVSGLSSGVAQVSAGRSHTCALMKTGGVKCWGANDDGEVDGSAVRTKLVPARVRGFGRRLSDPAPSRPRPDS